MTALFADIKGSGAVARRFHDVAVVAVASSATMRQLECRVDDGARLLGSRSRIKPINQIADPNFHHTGGACRHPPFAHVPATAARQATRD